MAEMFICDDRWKKEVMKLRKDEIVEIFRKTILENNRLETKLSDLEKAAEQREKDIQELRASFVAKQNM